MQPKAHIRYFSEPPSSVSALFYVEYGIDVCGWYAHAEQKAFSAAFFMLENFYVERSSALYRSLEDDVYGPWTNDCVPIDLQIRSPLPELLRHELERIQSNFVDEWLFFEIDPGASTEMHAYACHHLPIHSLNIKSRKLNRLERRNAIWEYRTPGVDQNVMEFVQKYWRSHDSAEQH